MSILGNPTPSEQKFLDALPKDQFILWRLVKEADSVKPRKIPCNPAGTAIDPHNRANWLNIEAARNCCRQSPLGFGIGIVLTAKDPFFVLDLDNVRDPATGAYTDEAVRLAKPFLDIGTGMEVSISGTGMHIFGTCDPSVLGERKNKWMDGTCEWYFAKRFVAFGVGQQGNPLIDCTNELAALVPKRESPAPEMAKSASGPCESWDGPSEDTELLARALGSGSAAVKFGLKASFAQFWNADLDALGRAFPSNDSKRPCDWSSADMAVFGSLAFWTGKDVARMIRLYQGSPLAQARGDKSQRLDYLERTARAAAETCQKVYSQSGGAGSEHSNADARPDMTDDELALHLHETYWSENARYAPELGVWLFWDGVRWKIDNTGCEHITRVRSQMREISKFASTCPRHKKRLESKNEIMNIAFLMASNPRTTIRANELDKDDLLLGTPNGVVDLRTGEFRPGVPGDLMTKSTSVDPAIDGASPISFLRFLDQIMGGDAEMIQYLQKVFGYSLTGSTKEHCMFFFYGSGRNGKGTLLNIFSYILKDYAVQAANAIFLDKKVESHPTDLAALMGARLVRSSELPVGKVWNDTLLKQVTGGDPISARKMRQDPINFTPQFTLIFDANNAPSVRGVDEAFRRRVKVVPFNFTVSEAENDPHLGEKLRVESPAILKWAIDGAIQWQRGGLHAPMKVREATNVYLDAEDTLGRFIDDQMLRDPAGRIHSSDLQTRFGQYLFRQGLSAWSETTLGKEMRKRGFKPFKSNGIRGFEGLRFQQTQVMSLIMPA